MKTVVNMTLTLDDVKVKDVDELFWRLQAFSTEVKDMGFEPRIGFTVQQLEEVK